MNHSVGDWHSLGSLHATERLRRKAGNGHKYAGHWERANMVLAHLVFSSAGSSRGVLL